MQNSTKNNIIIQSLIEWCQDRKDVCALLLTSSRANPNAPIDLFSDYDVILTVTDVQPYFRDRGWLETFGKVLVLYRDPIRLDHNLERFAYITQYENGTKIDFTVWPVELLHRVVEEPKLRPELDNGYIVLLDKDRLTGGLKPPSYQAHIPEPPSEEAYLAVVEEFFHDAAYVAKYLWRADLIPAKYSLDQVMKYKKLRQMLEWRSLIDHDWSVKLGAYGRGLKGHLPADTWAQFANTYVGPGIEENWEALFSTLGLFRQVASEVAENLGFEYPLALDQRMRTYLLKVKGLDRDAEIFTES